MLNLELEALDTIEQPSEEFWAGVVEGLGIVAVGVGIAVAIAT